MGFFYLPIVYTGKIAVLYSLVSFQLAARLPFILRKSLLQIFIETVSTTLKSFQVFSMFSVC